MLEAREHERKLPGLLDRYEVERDLLDKDRLCREREGDQLRRSMCDLRGDIGLRDCIQVGVSPSARDIDLRLPFIVYLRGDLDRGLSKEPLSRDLETCSFSRSRDLLDFFDLLRLREWRGLDLLLLSGSPNNFLRLALDLDRLLEKAEADRLLFFGFFGTGCPRVQDKDLVLTLAFLSPGR